MITHAKVTAIADDGTSDVGSDEWNAAHVFAGIPRVITTSLVVDTCCSYVVSGDFEIAAGLDFEIATGATLEIL